jgi:hypothetical protein
MNPLTIIAMRIMDLRAEFEAQLRAVARLEEQLRKATTGKIDDASPDVAKALRRDVTEMLANNANIRGVLNELATEAQIPTALEAPSRLPYLGNGADV